MRFSPILLLSFLSVAANAQMTLKLESESFSGVLHDNISNKQRQGSGFTPLVLKSYKDANLYRDDGVGLNFEHIFNGAKKHHGISMFTPRQDPSAIRRASESSAEIYWPAKGSKWGMEARMVYDFSKPEQVDLKFRCTPTKQMYPLGFAAMMWASYMNRTLDRKIHFWGTDGQKTGWLAFGEEVGKTFEVGTVACAGVKNLPYEKGAQTLNLIEHPTKRFITPFYYGIVDGDHNLKTTNDRLLYMVLFDQTESIRFAMWNFIKDKSGKADPHSPAWDWQYVIRNPQVGEVYGYRTRVVVKPFKGREQVWDEYRKWQTDLGVKLPQGK